MKNSIISAIIILFILTLMFGINTRNYYEATEKTYSKIMKYTTILISKNIPQIISINSKGNSYTETITIKYKTESEYSAHGNSYYTAELISTDGYNYYLKNLKHGSFIIYEDVTDKIYEMNHRISYFKIYTENNIYKYEIMFIVEGYGEMFIKGNANEIEGFQRQ